MPTRADATFVAFESFTQVTPRASATSSSRCGTPPKVRSVSATASAGRPRACAAAHAAIAFSTLCAPRRRSSSRGIGSGGNGGLIATSSPVWFANTRSFASR